MKLFCFLLMLGFIYEAPLHGGSHELLQNNGFELTPMIWTAYALPGGDALSAGITNLGNAHLGTWYAYVGDFNTSHSNAIGAVKQTVTIPSYTKTVTLNFYLNVTSQETAIVSKFDTMGAYLRTYPADVQAVTLHEWSNLDKDPNGVKNNYNQQIYSSDVSFYAGQQMTMQFYVQTDSSQSTTFRIDDVSLKANIPDYIIGVSAGPNGSVTPTGNTVVEAGQILNMTAAPSSGYTVDQWYVSGVSVQIGGSSLSAIINGATPILVTFKPITYVIAVSTDPNGSVNPNGNVSVNAGNNLTFTGTANSTYTVDQWYLNGTSVQNGGNSFTLNNVTANATLSVTFKQIQYKLTTSAAHGTIQVATVSSGPAISDYTPGTKLTLTPVPDNGYAFAQWSGDLFGVAQPFSLLLDANKLAIANFVPIIPPTAISTPIVLLPSPGQPRMFSCQIPTLSGWNYIFQVSRNSGANWSCLSAFAGNGSIQTVTDVFSTAPDGARYKWSAEPKADIAPFLTFPITNDLAAEITAYTAPVTAVFDNDGLGDVANGGILLFTGQLVTFASDRCMRFTLQGTTVPCSDITQAGLIGYKQDASGSDLILPINYLDADPSTTGNKGTIWYDGHTGYDYSFPSTSHVLAAADGTIDAESNFDHTGNNQIAINHGGHKTYYLHLDHWEHEFVLGQSVKAGDKIGYPGDKGAAGHVHLHFTVKKLGTDKVLRRVDPYGLVAEDKSQASPVLWVKHP